MDDEETGRRGGNNLYDQSSRHYKDNSKKVIAWRAIALEIGSSARPSRRLLFGARGVLLTRVKMRAVPLRRRWVKALTATLRQRHVFGRGRRKQIGSTLIMRPFPLGAAAERLSSVPGAACRAAALSFP
ncbi:unnamed protein product [Boreogadus saida]